MLDFKHRKGRLRIDNRLQKGLKATYIEKDNPVLTETRKQLDEYFAGQREIFTVPLLTVGSEFQKSVWRALMNVPYGHTSTYLNIAQEIHNPKRLRMPTVTTILTQGVLIKFPPMFNHDCLVS
ncbi:hypothetical protein MNBD_GAMMA04-1868 [hydrothermal vent metagenome]|uniref:Methylated-DNA--[protein]-cysteine S-methyltransferase n=1 Tax=hydrothermal vent metagenome TaxID=652676 RepID=A0A3B0VXH9_9ZZZZ